MSTLTIEPVAVPLREDPTGAIRIGESRVLLDMVIHAFWKGQSPEGIAQSYDTLELPDVYAVLAYYLTHRAEVDAYLARREQEAEALRLRIQASQPPTPDLKERLLRRAASGEGDRAPAAR